MNLATKVLMTALMMNFQFVSPIIVSQQSCGNSICHISWQSCVATIPSSNRSFDPEHVLNEPAMTLQCLSNFEYVNACQNCAKGEFCLIEKLDNNVQFNVSCLYEETNLDKYDIEHSSPLGTEDLPIFNGNLDASLPWCILVGIVSFLPIIVILGTLFYRFVYKLPLQGKAKEELKKIFASNGFDENESLYEEVQEFFYH